RLSSPDIRAKIAVLMGVAFIDVATEPQRMTCNSDPDEDENGAAAVRRGVVGQLANSHGAMFQLAQIANLAAQGKTITDIEGVRKVDIHATTAGVRKVVYKDLERRVDIIVDEGDGERWVETKSWAANKVPKTGVVEVNAYRKNLRNWQSAAQKDSGGNVQREFFIDRVHAGGKRS